MNNTSKLLTPEQVADILQIHVLTVYNYIKKGKFEAVRLGRTYRIDPEDLDRFVQSSKSGKVEKPEKDASVSHNASPVPVPDKKAGRV